MTSIFDDGTVVGLGGEPMRKKLGHATAGHDTAGFIAASQLRWSILEEERLRRSIAYEEKLRRIAPDTWRAREVARRTANREIAETNRRLRSLGLEPLRPEPSLAQGRQKLQRLERQNEAEIATFRGRSSKSRPRSHGTPLARRRSGRIDD